MAELQRHVVKGNCPFEPSLGFAAVDAVDDQRAHVVKLDDLVGAGQKTLDVV